MQPDSQNQIAGFLSQGASLVAASPLGGLIVRDGRGYVAARERLVHVEDRAAARLVLEEAEEQEVGGPVRRGDARRSREEAGDAREGRAGRHLARGGDAVRERQAASD